MRFVGFRGLWVWVPERPPEPCRRCVAAGASLENCWHWFVDCPWHRWGGGGVAQRRAVWGGPLPL